MSEQKLFITPETTVAELLEHYPGLEQRLLELSPAFAKLKNPILRRTVARITTLQRAAQVAGLNAVDMVNTLRRAVGEPLLESESFKAAEEELLMRLPMELGSPEVTLRFDIRPLLERGEYPKTQLMERVKEMGYSDVLELIASFPPLPVIEILLGQGFQVSRAARSEDGALRYYVRRS
ncbi:DUF1858 domain-containing protein [Porphyromonas circumdentaria]|uniref:Uncharacterized conserved protein n=1 Tax=Porphyromonas circumdentaria TaxID=29524 RepID=A0A1T4PBF2_9PORP|nr:DUF1858 domain-containing protein [Porphyromonas circumdentaria]MBB6276359.1 hypothetical protein [Porphyromonas circumdentaria]SJZ88687.1 Uncharacterized conserved protein [Porphyromonas circumdentaria]